MIALDSVPALISQAALTLSESFQVSLAARYSEATQPLVLNLEIDSCRAEIVIATTKCQAFDAVTEQAKGKSKSTTVPAQVSAPAPVPVPSMAKRKATQAASGATQAGRRLKLSSQAVIPESQFRSASQLDRPGSASQQQPLFLPGGSQREYVVDEEAEARSRQSQKVALEAAGLDGFKEDELLGMMEGDVTMEDGAAGAESLGDGDYGEDDDMRLDEDTGAEGSREKSETVVEDDDETTDKENEEEVIEDDEEALPPTGKPTNNVRLWSSSQPLLIRHSSSPSTLHSSQQSIAPFCTSCTVYLLMLARPAHCPCRVALCSDDYD